jgi:hypothetical protein
MMVGAFLIAKHEPTYEKGLNLQKRRVCRLILGIFVKKSNRVSGIQTRILEIGRCDSET